MRKAIVLINILFIAAIMGCSRSPEAYNPTNPVRNPVNIQKIPSFEKPFPVIVDGAQKTSTELIDALIDGEEKIDAQKTFNSRQPILYGVGVAGITFQTTLEESQLILTPPPFGVAANDTALYEEGIYVQWRKADPKTPDFILILEGYLGEMQFPAPHAPLKMKQDLSLIKPQYKKNTKEGAEAIARDYFRILEKKDENYDCIAKNTCRLNWGDANQKDFFFEIPNRMVWMVSKDRFTLFRMLIQKATSPGIFDHVVDLAKAEFLIPQEAPVALGNTYAEIEKRQAEYAEKTGLIIEPYPAVYVDSLAREYDGVNAGYLRSQFDRKNETPESTDVLQNFLVYGGFQNPFMMNGQAILVTETATDVSIQMTTPDKIANPKEETEFSRTSPLVINMGFKASNVKIFAEKFTELYKNELQKMYPKAMVSAQITGYNKRKQFKDYTAQIYAFDFTADEGVYAQFTVGEEQGNIYGFYISKLGSVYNSADKLILKDANSPLVKQFGMVPKKNFLGAVVLDDQGQPVMVQGKLSKFTKLGGVSLGDTFIVKNWDLGRNEANVEFKDSTGVEHNLRASYFDVDQTFLAFELSEPVFQRQATVDIGNLNLRVGLKLVAETAEQRTYKVMTLTTATHRGEVTGICESASLKYTVGMSVEAFSAMAKTEPNCKAVESYNGDGTKSLQYVYYPEDRIRFNFSEDTLDSITIYSRQDEVK